MPETWINGLIGGLMIGTAASVFLLASGRIMGASGVLGALFPFKVNSRYIENLVFIIGLIFAPALWGIFQTLQPTNATSNWVVLSVAGLLVGYGTRLGSGCTSGHGVCGMSRFSKRSIISTLIYICSGIITVIIIKYLGVIQ